MPSFSYDFDFGIDLGIDLGIKCDVFMDPNGFYGDSLVQSWMFSSHPEHLCMFGSKVPERHVKVEVEAEVEVEVEVEVVVADDEDMEVKVPRWANKRLRISREDERRMYEDAMSYLEGAYKPTKADPTSRQVKRYKYFLKHKKAFLEAIDRIGPGCRCLQCSGCLAWKGVSNAMGKHPNRYQLCRYRRQTMLAALASFAAKAK